MLFIYNDGWLVKTARCSENEIQSIVAKTVAEAEDDDASFSYYYE